LTASGVQSTSTNLTQFKTDGYKTPREVIDEANAYHGWVARVDGNGDLTFKPQPTEPRFEVGQWSGYEFQDQAASSGEDIYSRVIVSGQGPDGQTLMVARTAAQLASSSQLSSGGASSLTAAQRASLVVRALTPSDVALTTTSGKVNPQSYDLTAKNMASVDPPSGAGVVLSSGAFKAGVTYRVTVSFNIDDPGTSNQPVWFRFGTDGYAAGTQTNAQTGATASLTTDATYTNVVQATAVNNNYNQYAYQLLVYWTPATDQTLSSTWGAIAVSPAKSTGNGGSALVLGDTAGSSGYVNRTGQLNASIKFMAGTLAEARGLRRTYQLTAPGVQTTTTLAAIGDAWLFNHLKAQFRGSITTTGATAIRQASTGDAVHPSRLLLEAGEVIRLSDRLDPDTGQLGREARIASVSYDHDAQSVSIELDNRRDNLQTFLNRLAAA
jgi:hypothetical protein